MKIRKAIKKDIKEIVDIFKKESSTKPYTQKWTTKKAFKKIAESIKNHDVYVAVVDKKVVGFVISYIEKDNKKKAYIDELWLKLDYQRKGIGKAIMEFIEKMYKKRGVNVIQLVSKKKSGAFKFYNKLKYNNSKDLVFMDKRLK